MSDELFIFAIVLFLVFYAAYLRWAWQNKVIHVYRWRLFRLQRFYRTEQADNPRDYTTGFVCHIIFYITWLVILMIGIAELSAQ